MTILRGVGISHFEREYNLKEIIEAVKDTTPEGTKIVVADDGSSATDILTHIPKDVLFIRGPNKGVAWNKNRLLYALQDCLYICILEDDLKPIAPGWFEKYETAAQLIQNHYFVRVQDKEVVNQSPEFGTFMQSHGLTPVIGSSPRGDLTFMTRDVTRLVGAFDPRFIGVGFAHGNHAERAYNAGLICHPQKWIDIAEARDMFVQIGDSEGGRWNHQEKTKEELERNKKINEEISKQQYTFLPIECA